MGLFTCNSCGESLKKNEVYKHMLNCWSLACKDCGKNFWNIEYRAHNKCTTEDKNANKGEKKRDEWIEVLRSQTEQASFTDEKVKLILERALGGNNTALNETKFKNFLRNYIVGVNRSLLSSAWDNCITEDDKYGGKNYISKPTNKIKRMRIEWIKSLRSQLEHDSFTNEKCKLILEKGFNVDESLLSRAWDIFKRARNELQVLKKDKKKRRQAEKETARAAVDSRESNLNSVEENNLDAVNGNGSLSIKEKRRRKRKHAEDSIADVPDAQEAEDKTSSLTKKEKKKKRKLVEVDATEDSIENENGENVSLSKKERKRLKQMHADDQNANENVVVIEEVKEEDKLLTKEEKRRKDKFRNDELNDTADGSVVMMESNGHTEVLEVTGNDGSDSSTVKGKKHKKRKHADRDQVETCDVVEDEVLQLEEETSSTKKDKKKKNRLSLEEASDATNVSLVTTDSNDNVEKDDVHDDNDGNGSLSKKSKKNKKRKHADRENVDESNEIIDDSIAEEDTSLTKKEKKKKQRKMIDEDVDGITVCVENLVNGQDDSVTATEKRSKRKHKRKSSTKEVAKIESSS